MAMQVISRDAFVQALPVSDSAQDLHLAVFRQWFNAREAARRVARKLAFQQTRAYAGVEAEL